MIMVAILEGKEEANAWRRANIDKVIIYNQSYRARQNKADGDFTLEEWEKLLKEYNYECAICGTKEENLKDLYEDERFHKLQKDNVIPLAKGGNNYIENIQPLCVSCNARKWANMGV